MERQDAAPDPLPGPGVAEPLARPVRTHAGRGFGGDYWRLFAASVVSNLGDGISAVAYPWLAAVLTRDPVLVAGVGVARRLPWLLFSLPAGAIVDRGDRRRLMVTSNAVRFLVTTAVALAVLLDGMTVPLLYAAVLVLGFAEVLFDNAAQTVMPLVVTTDKLERANGNLWSGELVMNELVGPPLGGLLVAVALALPFGIDAVTFGLSAVLIATLTGSFRVPASDVPAARLAARVTEGIRWLWRHRVLRALALSLGVMSAAGSAAVATEVLFAQEILGLGAGGFGVLFSAGALGGVAGGQAGPLINRRLGPGTALRAAIVVMALAYLGIAVTSNAVVVGVMFFSSAFAAFVWNVITVSLRQAIIPPSLLGRVNSAYRFLGWGTMPAGAFLGGALVAVVSAVAGRELGLRAPLLAAGAVHLGLLLLAPSFSTQAITEAKAAGAR